MLWNIADAQHENFTDSIIPIQNVKYWIEEDKSLTIKECLKKIEDTFEFSYKKVNVSPDWTVWMRIDISTITDAKSYFLTVGDFDEITLFYKSEDIGYKSYQNGRFVKPSERIINNIPIAFPLHSLNRNFPFLIKVNHYNPLEKRVVQPLLIGEKKYNQLVIIANNNKTLNSLNIGLVGGLFLAFLIYPVAFYFFNKQNYYVYYSTYIALNFILLIYTSEKFSDLDVFFSFYPWTLINLEPLIYGSVGISYFYFLKSFILFIKKSKTINFVLKALIIYECTLIATDIIIKVNFEIVNFPYRILTFGLLPIIFGILYVAYKLFLWKDKVLFYIAVGIICIAIGQISMAMICTINFEPGSFWSNPNIIFHIFVVFELFFFSLALSQTNQDFRKKQMLQEISLKEEVLMLQRSALQAQMNPHFIFNCLNSIQNFILQNDRKKAVEYLSRFAKLVRHNLNASVNGGVSLEEEVNLLDNYLALERERFDQQFDYKIEVGEELEKQFVEFPSMLIQPYVENAVIHGLSEKKEGGKISVGFNSNNGDLVVKIQDNGKGYRQHDKGEQANRHKSVGMSITQKRLELLGADPFNSVQIQTLKNQQNELEGTAVTIRIKIKSIEA